jgi:hypothetical protein
LTWPAGRRLGYALLWLILLVGVAEAVVRVPRVKAGLAAPSYGIANRQFELTWARLKAYVAEQGQPDCIFIGSSQVLRGIEPLTLAAAYHETTGQDLRCFTFGVRGLDAENSYDVARLLLLDYRPRLLIFGTDIPSYSPQRAAGLRGDIGRHAWLRYRLGEASLEGWLIDHSAALQAYLPYRFWYWPAYASQQAEAEKYEYQITREGFGQLDRTARNIDQPPQPGDSQEEFFDLLHDFTLSDEQLASLDDILALRSSVGVLVVEMPLHPSFFYFFAGGRADYDRGLKAVRERIAATDVEFIETTQQLLIPDEGWANRNHLNTTGALVLSRWLGQRLGTLAVAGRLAGIQPVSPAGGPP